MSWRDRTIAILLGVVLGIGIVVAFVFVFSEQTVDAPSLSPGETTAGPRIRQRDHRPGHGSSRSRHPPLATISVVGGAPPPSGPPELHYRKGELVRLRVVSDASIVVELTGYGLVHTVTAHSPTELDFKASKAGTFALIITSTRINVARIIVGRGRIL